MPATDLFTYAEFASYLKEAVDNSSTDVARRIASGWLLDATGLSDWTAPVGDQIFGWAIELAAIAYRNPDGVATESVDDHSVTWDRERRKAILTQVRTSYGTSGQPQYSFPDWDWHWAAAPVTDPLTT